MSGAEPVELVWCVAAKEINHFCSLEESSLTRDPNDLERVRDMLAQASFAAREEVEEDPSRKQIIPYLVVCNGDRILSYTRAGSEERLTGLVSIGLGGHVNPVDAHDFYFRTVRNCVFRELEEELRLEGVDDFFSEFRVSLDPFGVLYDDSNPVGRVHLGIVLTCQVDDAVAYRLRIREEGKDLAWRTREELTELYEELEGWSQIVLDGLG